MEYTLKTREGRDVTIKVEVDRNLQAFGMVYYQGHFCCAFSNRWASMPHNVNEALMVADKRISLEETLGKVADIEPDSDTGLERIARKIME